MNKFAYKSLINMH